MRNLTPSIRIEGRDQPFIKGAYTNTGGLTSATLQFDLPLTYGGYKKLWNKEVTFYLDTEDGKPLFRGYIKRIKEDFNKITIFAQDVIGYMVKGGNPEKATIVLNDRENIDGLTVGNAMRKAIKMANLDSKIGTDYIGDTIPAISSSRPPLRGTMSVLNIIKTLLGRAVDDSGAVPRTNIARIVDDGSTSQLVIDLESETSSSEIKHVYTEDDNITGLQIINRKVPTVIVVTGAEGVAGTFTHEGALAAFDRNYLKVSNKALKSPAECKDFAQKLFRANLTTQYEYSIKTFEGAHLNENDVIRVEARDPKFTGNYRVRGKKIAFSPSSFDIGLNINRKPPTLAEFVTQQDN